MLSVPASTLYLRLCRMKYFVQFGGMSEVGAHKWIIHLIVALWILSARIEESIAWRMGISGATVRTFIEFSTLELHYSFRNHSPRGRNKNIPIGLHCNGIHWMITFIIYWSIFHNHVRFRWKSFMFHEKKKKHMNYLRNSHIVGQAQRIYIRTMQESHRAQTLF